ncbi:usick-Kaufman Bardet-Biedl syndromes chaperonin, partial [Brachionus plicatilis]
MESSISIIDNSENSYANLVLDQILKINQNLILSSVGPKNSKFKLIQNRPDSDTLQATTASKNLLENLYKINDAEKKDSYSFFLIKWKFDLISSTLIKSHVNSHFDSGLFAAFLINQSILLKCEKSFINKILVDLIEHLTSLVEIHLVKFRLNLDDLGHLKALIDACLNAKKITQIAQDDGFTNQFLKLLIKSFNNDHFSRILYILNENMLLGLNDSQIFDGILVKTDQVQFNSIKNPRCLILDTNCLSGDFEEFDTFGFKFQINLSEVNSENEQFINLNYLINRIKIIVEKFQIDAIFCQKVVHPSVKHYFKKHKNLFVLDRLGLDLAKPIQEILNCKMCNSISCDLDDSYIGTLDYISLVSLHGKNYFHLQSQVPVQTIVVGVQNESFTSELEYVLKITERTFQRGVLSGYGLIGGPCFYSYCINFLWSRIEKKREEIKKLIFVKNLFFKFLKSLTDAECEYGICLNTGHYFNIESLKCECGMIIRRNKDNLFDLDDFNLDKLNINLIFKNQNFYEINLKNLKLIDCFQSK